MRKLLISTAILAFALSSVQAQNLDQILKAHYKASGQEKLAKIKTVITTGKNNYATAGIESSFTIYQAKPDNLRVQADFMGSEVIQTYNGTTGWMYAPAMGITQPQELADAELKTVLQQASFESQLWNYQEKGHTLELLGSTDDGSAHKLKMIQEDDTEMTFLIDKKSNLITGLIIVQGMGDSEAEMVSTMKDYKSVKGIQTAHYISTKMDGELIATVVIESIEYDKDIDPALFEKPMVE